MKKYRINKDELSGLLATFEGFSFEVPEQIEDGMVLSGHKSVIYPRRFETDHVFVHLYCMKRGKDLKAIVYV